MCPRQAWERKNKSINKSAIYRELSEIHTARTTKSFEFKFQNISAVLYEEKLLYADGLRPMGNYRSNRGQTTFIIDR